MGDPLYLGDPANPDERDRLVRGIDKSQPAPADALFYNLLPTAGYVYDPIKRMWVPAEQVSPALIVLLQQIAAYAEGTDETTAGILASWLSAIKRQGTPGLLYGTTQPRVRTAADGDLVSADGTRQGTQYVHDFGVLNAGVLRKYVGIDGGAYTPPGAGATTISFTGVNLLGRLSKFVINVTDWMRHEVTAVADPVAPAVGTITIRPAVPTAGALFILPYQSVPHAYETTTDALRMKNIAPEWSHYVEGTVAESLSGAAIGDQTKDIDLPYSDYKTVTVQADWTNNNVAEAIRVDIYGRLAGSTVWRSINALFTVTGTARGAAVQNGGLTAILTTPPLKLDEIRIEWIKTGAVAGNDTLLITYSFG